LPVSGKILQLPPAPDLPIPEVCITDTPEGGVFDSIFRALDVCSRPVIGPAESRLLVIPLRDRRGRATGGLWGSTMFEWLQIHMLFVPEALRGRGIGSAIVAAAEREAVARGCRGANVDTFSFQAAPFYQRLGYQSFGVLEDCPPGHQRIFLSKRLREAPAKTGATTP